MVEFSYNDFWQENIWNTLFVLYIGLYLLGHQSMELEGLRIMLQRILPSICICLL